MNSRIRRPLYISLKSWLCWCGATVGSDAATNLCFLISYFATIRKTSNRKFKKCVCPVIYQVDVHFLCSHLGISAIIRSLHQAALTYKTYWQYSQKCKLMHGKCFLPALVSYNVIFLLQLLRIDQKSILYFLCSQCLFQCY